MLRAWTVAAAALALLAIVAAPVGAADRPEARNVARVASLEVSVLAEINAVRARHGRAPLRMAPALTAAATSHSRAMATRGFFKHESADGSDFGRRLKRFYRPSGYRRWRIGENILWSSPEVDAQRAVQMWMDSPPHRANLLSRDWREIGLSAVHSTAAPGFFRGLEVTVLTADFGARA
jgi:uncharacterized protein YkwD